ncbi:hypothetical protein NBG4_300012 [Candidatus Sulfobium mesophilum]|uniref:Uncharacterized protein n=1 Tax=Candidatus Sulfobium mesophilum TaxID=2016548 RepID=A0A2U3QH79_9BACT|nr:hypothetical protein NBG4_300012 [Candidatus Sulfobium mesophilum]
MKAQEIFQSSVEAMKELLTRQEMADSIKRARERGEEGNFRLLEKERKNVNELVRRIVDAGGSTDVVKTERLEVIDAMVMRYLKNREVFMKTFPDGIEGVDADRFSIWASIMISPADESPAS